MKDWSFSEKIIVRFFTVFVFLFIISFSFPHNYLPDAGKFVAPLFEPLVKLSANTVFGINHYTSHLVSDSTDLYVHVFNLFILSLVFCIIWSFLDKKRKNYDSLFYWLLVVARYYLALQLFVYGFNKVFKWQFYLPEPNTLYTPLGSVPPDLFYWSTMGISRSYTVFLGIAEVLAASLLLFRRTTLFASLLSVVILVNVLVINFSFDISVKIYSAFLLLLALLIAVPDAKRLFYFLFSDKVKEYKKWNPVYTSPKAHTIYRSVKTIVICFMLFDVLSIYFITTNFNDDKESRPFFHGAYDVTLFVKNNDTLQALTTDTFRWKRMFVHRRGYLITQFMNDEMQDYKLEYDTLQHRLIIEDYETNEKTDFAYYQMSDTTLVLHGKMKNDSLKVYLKKIKLDALPVFQNDFHFTSDY